MPRKRRVGKHRAPITQEAVRAFKAGDWIGTHRALQLRPWEASPLDAETPTAPGRAENTAWATSWAQAHALRLDLEAA